MASPRSEHISRRRTDDLAECFLSRGSLAFQPIVAGRDVRRAVDPEPQRLKDGAARRRTPDKPATMGSIWPGQGQRRHSYLAVRQSAVGVGGDDEAYTARRQHFACREEGEGSLPW
jgi:hypothetical protein